MFVLIGVAWYGEDEVYPRKDGKSTGTDTENDSDSCRIGE